jgi:hypothetical protein
MKRLVWLGIGLAVGALVVRKATRAAQSFTPGGIASSVAESTGGLVATVRSFMEDVRSATAEREQEIHEALAAQATLDGELGAGHWSRVDER